MVSSSLDSWCPVIKKYCLTPHWVGRVAWLECWGGQSTLGSSLAEQGAEDASIAQGSGKGCLDLTLVAWGESIAASTRCALLACCGPDVHIHMCSDFTDTYIVLKNTPSTHVPWYVPIHLLCLIQPWVWQSAWNNNTSVLNWWVNGDLCPCTYSSTHICFFRRDLLMPHMDVYIIPTYCTHTSINAPV